MTAIKLKALRNKHGLSQSAASALVHVTQRSWARYESGDRAAPVGMLELFCIKLGEKYPDALI
ncbi:MAG TPA: transcriptional regulator [Pseudomonas sp.]|nr:transcriptional regulator [Pseudomonas sp.]